MLWQLAWRNVLRNRRRSVITASSITIGVAALTFIWGFVDGMNREMVDNTTRLLASDAQVHLKGYHDDPSLDLTITNAETVLETVRGDPRVAAASVRMEGSALASSGEKSRGIILIGVAPREEALVTDLFKAIVEGEPFAEESASGALIGIDMARAMGLKVGDEIVLVGQAYDGAVASDRVRVRGVFRTKIDELDGYIAVLPLEVVREFFAAPGSATAVAFRLKDRGSLAATQASLSARLGERYEIAGWPTLLPMVAASVRYHEVIGMVVLAVFFSVVAAGVANPVLMAVLERTREFGIMLAIGITRRKLLALVLCEAVLLGLVGLTVGNVLGIAITSFFQSKGIDFSAFEAGLRTMPGLSDIVYPVVRANRSVMISAVVFGTTVLVALYPAAKAALLEPVAAIRGLAGGRVRAYGGRNVSTRWPVFLLIASRNVLRNPARTLITAVGTAFAIVAFVFLFGYYDGFGEQIIDNATRYLSGHIQVERSGFRTDLGAQYSLYDAPALAQRLRGAHNVLAVAPRVQAQAVASSATKSQSITLIGVDPEREQGVTFIHQAVVEGGALRTGGAMDVLIGRALAEKLNVRLGEKIVVMVQGADGELATAAYRVRGIFSTESASFDRAMAFVTLPAAQGLLSLGDRVSTINLRLEDRAELGETVSALRRLLPEPGLALVPWPELLPQVDGMVKVVRVMRTIVLAITLAVVALAVMNTVFMAVTERTREFGVMMALGMAPNAVIRMVLYETSMLLALASLLGYGVGVLLVAYLGREGLDLSALFEGYSAIPGLTGIVYPRLLAGSIILPGVLLFLASVLVSLQPASRAARLDPARAVRHV
jgi:ABC-type lipoprotein release transport system permease subunit